MNEHLRRSRRQEKRGAKLFNGSRNAGSGNKARKNDVRNEAYSIEFKTTTADSFRLKRSDLELAERQAIKEHRKFLFGLDFVFSGRTSRYVIISESDLLELLNGTEAQD